MATSGAATSVVHRTSFFIGSHRLCDRMKSVDTKGDYR